MDGDRLRLRARIVQRPNAVRYRELERLLETYGWVARRGKGSHRVFTRQSQSITVPYRRGHVLPVYVRQVFAACKEEHDG